MIMQFNVLWLNPRDIHTFPEGLMDALDDHTSGPMLLLSQHDNKNTDIESRLRQQMQADALRPMSSGMDDDPGKAALPTHDWSSDTIQEAIQYLRLNVCVVIASREQSISYHKRGRHETDYIYCFRIYATATHIVSGAERNTTTTMTWMPSVLERMKRITTDLDPFLEFHIFHGSCDLRLRSRLRLPCCTMAQTVDNVFGIW
jgi:hypothetical protein